MTPVHRLACAAVLLSAGVAGAWERTGPRGQALAVAVDAGHDVVAGGFVADAATGEDAAIVRLSSADGALLWQWRLDGPAHADDRISAVAVDPSTGDAVGVGRVTVADGDLDPLVVKLGSADGALLWGVVLDGTGGNDEALGVAVAPGGDVVVAGRLSSAATLGDFAVVRLAGRDGTVVWERRLDGGANADDLARVVALDAAGDVLAAGRMADGTGGSRLAVVKLRGADGDERWRRLLDSGAAEGNLARALALDGAGDVVAAGRFGTAATGQDLAVVKLAGGDGAEQWRYVTDGGAAGDDEAFAAAADGRGDVIVAGELLGDTGIDFAVVKLSSSAAGALLWHLRLDGNEARDGALAVAVDGAGDVVAAGRMRNPETRDDFTVVKAAGASGAVLWRRAISRDPRGVEAAVAVAVDDAGDAVAAGRTRSADGQDELTVVKLSGATGGSYPCGNGGVEAAAGEECDDGNLVDGDGCDAACRATRCGNGVVTGGEECDDGNTDAGDCCSPACRFETDGAPCSDGSACTRRDTCRSGRCAGAAPVVCVAPNACQESTCDPADGSCTVTFRPDGTACSDRSACTVSDECGGGQCVAGPPLGCDDGRPCTDDGCDPTTGCTHVERVGFAGVRCGFERSLAVPACAGDVVPAGVTRRYGRAEELVVRAEEATTVPRARRLLMRAARLLKRAGTAVSRASRRRRDPLSAACAADLAPILADVRARADILRQSLPAATVLRLATATAPAMGATVRHSIGT